MKATTNISFSILINAAKEEVWEIISDLGGIQNYHPLVRKSYYITDNKNGVGAARICEFKNGGVLEEKSVEWIEGESVNLNVIPGKKMPPFKTAFAKMKVERINSKTIASLTIEYELKFGLAGRLMNLLMVKPQFEKIVPSILEGLKQYTESNKKAAA